MTAEKKMANDITVDIDVAMMINKRCNKEGELTLPKFLSMEDFRVDYNILERFMFWSVIWKELSKLGWILDKDGNFESEFIVLSPLDPICNTMKKNIDFFDDESELMLALAADPRLVVMKEIRELRERFDDYMIQFRELKTFFSGRNIPWQLNDNKSVLQYLETRVADRKQKREVEQRTMGLDDEKTKDNLLRCIMAEQERQRQVDEAKLATIPVDPRHRKRLQREMIIAEYERRKQMNGGRFPTDPSPPEPQEKPVNLLSSQQEQAVPTALLKAQAILDLEREANIRRAIATTSQRPPQSGRTVSLSSLPGQQQQQQQQQQAPALAQALEQLLSPQRPLSGLSPATAALETALRNGAIPTSAAGQIGAQPRRISLPPSQSSVEAGLREQIIHASLKRRLSLPSSMSSPMSSSNNSSSSASLQQQPTTANAGGLKLSWNEIESAFHDLKKPKQQVVMPKTPSMLDVSKISPLGLQQAAATTQLQELINAAKMNAALGPQTRLQEALLSKKRQRLF